MLPRRQIFSTAAPPALPPNPAALPATVEELEQIAARAGLGDAWVLAQVRARATAEQARTTAWTAQVDRQPDRTAVVTSSGGRDDRQAFIMAAAGGLAAQIGGPAAEGPAQQFARGGVTSVAREAMIRAGHDASRLSGNDAYDRAMGIRSFGGMVTTTDLPFIVQQAIRFTMLPAYRAAQSPLAASLAKIFTSVNGDRTVQVARLADMFALYELPEHAEVRRSPMADATPESFKVLQYAGMTAITNELLRRDNMDAVAALLRSPTKAAAETEAKGLLAVLTANAGAGVTMSDGFPLFSVAHGNLGNLQLSVAGLSAARLALRRTKAPDGVTLAPTAPKYLLVGPELETQAEQLLAQLTAANSSQVNPFAGQLTLLVEPRLPGTGWFMFADPADAAVLGVGYFDNEEKLKIDTKEGWDVLGLEVRAVLDFGAGAVGWRGAYYSTGTTAPQ